MASISATPTQAPSLPTVTEATFEAEVLASKVPVLVDFTTAWCGPCKLLKPVLQDLARENAGHLKVVMIDGDDSAAVASRYGIRGFPTILAFSGGKEIGRHVGLTKKDRLLALVQRA